MRTISTVTVSGREKPYYLTRERTTEEKKIIAEERKRAKILTASCVSGGLLGTVIYFGIKLLRRRPTL